MNSLTIIGFVICLIVGFIVGLVVEMLANASYVKSLEAENARLRDRLKKNNTVKIIEINDNREVVPEDLDWSRTW